jgi:glycosyltransferase involved in cell wall biosynthesis
MVADSLGGGLGAAVAAGCRWLAPRGWDLVVAAPAPPAATIVAEIDARIEVVDIPRSARSIGAASAAARQLRALVRDLRPDIVHCHGVRSFVITRSLAGQRAMVTLHGTGASVTDPRGYHVVRRAGVATIPALAQRALAAVPGLGRGWVFAPHASPRLAELEPLPPPPPGGPFLWLGRLEDPKRPGLFVDAVALAAREAAVHGVIAGSGALEGSLRAQITRTGAPVELVGHRRDVADLLRACTAAVLFSRSEAVPFAVQEPMWAGRAVIASRLPGTAWLAGTAGPGLTLVDDAEQAAAAMVALACSPATARDHGTAAASRVRDALAPDSPWPQVEAAYRAVAP